MTHTMRTLTAVFALTALAALLGSRAVLAQEESTPEPDAVTPAEKESTIEETVEGGLEPIEGLVGQVICGPTDCCPPSTQQKVMVGVGTLFLAVVFLFLFVALAEKRFILQDRDPQLGRHSGISLAIVLSSGALAALTKLVSGCFHSETIVWLIFIGVVWAIHGLYTLIVVRSG